MYYEKECKNEIQQATNPVNPYRSISVIQYASLHPNGSPSHISPDFRGKDPAFNHFVNTKIGLHTEDQDRSQGFSPSKCSQIKNIVYSELQCRNQALGLETVTLAEPSEIDIEEIRIETSKLDVEDWGPEVSREPPPPSSQSSVYDEDLIQFEDDNVNEDNEDENEDGAALHDLNDQEVEEILNGDSEFLPVGLGWELIEDSLPMRLKKQNQSPQSRSFP